MRIVEKSCPQEKYSAKCPYTRTPRFVVVHNTGNDAPAENEAAYMQRREEEVSFHFAVDEDKAVQCLPLDRNAWASGDGRGPGNMYGIHVEICRSLSGGERFTKAEQNAARLTAGLLKRYGWGPGQVKKHQDFDGKYCPHRTLDLGWQRFLNLVKAELERLNKKEEPKLTEAQVKEIARKEAQAVFAGEFARRNPTYDTLEQAPEYWREEIRLLLDQGVLKGSGKGAGGAVRLDLTRSEAKAAVLVARALKSRET
ncbi:peptidoglycan recognition protein family protein [Acutalibacter sp. 1XD8-33]|uniref:peptidoglycan recognition protein family protein n=1 Tax=Acutalibacter sp. 1XD8-33 TaxID=2320081 RepID=UPI0018F7A066|nr:N-acetylmuramoyl-L-alanine amidase [Acutalibacter sp. 1XD8-33]